MSSISGAERAVQSVEETLLSFTKGSKAFLNEASEKSTQVLSSIIERNQNIWKADIGLGMSGVKPHVYVDEASILLDEAKGLDGRTNNLYSNNNKLKESDRQLRNGSTPADTKDAPRSSNNGFGRGRSQ